LARASDAYPRRSHCQLPIRLPLHLLRARTRRDYDQVLDYLDGTIGQVAVASIKRPQVIAQMEANAFRTRFANYIQQVLSVLFEHAIDLGWLDHNPAKAVRKLKTPAERRAPHFPWTDERHRNLPGARQTSPHA
jgi:predicted deacylase